MSVSDENCLDVSTERLFRRIAAFGCHGMGGNQFFAFSKNGQIVTAEDACVGVAKDLVVQVPCNETDVSQLWKYDNTVSVNIIVDLKVDYEIFLLLLFSE